jgi:hypothetical protein
MRDGFTYEELLRIFQLSLSAEEADRLARAGAQDSEVGASTATSGLAVGGVSFSGDTLILLSLLSESTNARVEKHRRLGNRHIGENEQREWETRREELRKEFGQQLRVRP